MMEFLSGINLYIWAPIIVISILIIAALLYRPVAAWFAGARTKKEPDNERLNEIIEDAGYSYDPGQDIFYSNMDPWQRKMGYCRLYDEA